MAGDEYKDSDNDDDEKNDDYNYDLFTSRVGTSRRTVFRTDIAVLMLHGHPADPFRLVNREVRISDADIQPAESVRHPGVLIPVPSFVPRLHFGTRFLTTCATLNFPLAVSGTN